MDCFLSEGIETIFRIALTLLMIAKHELLLLDMEGVIKYFQVGLCLFAIILLFVKLQFLPQMTNIFWLFICKIDVHIIRDVFTQLVHLQYMHWAD